MAKFFLDLHQCGDLCEDQDGVEAEHFAAAREIAVISARDIMCGEIRTGSLCLSCYIEISDEDRNVLGTVAFRDAVVVTGLGAT